MLTILQANSAGLAARSNNLVKYALATLAIIFTLCAPAPAAATINDFAEAVPQDSTILLQARNLEQLRKQWAETSLANVWDEPVMMILTQTIRSYLDMLKHTERNDGQLSEEDLRQIFGGQAAIVVRELFPMGDSYVYDATLLLEMRDVPPATFKKYAELFSADAPERAERNVLTIEDAKIYQVKYPQEMLVVNGISIREDQLEELRQLIPEERRANMEIKHEKFDRNIQYGFIDGVFLLCDGDDQTGKDFVRLLRRLNDNSLAHFEPFEDAFRKHDKEWLMRMWLNFDRYRKYRNDQARELYGGKAEQQLSGMEHVTGLGASLAMDGGQLRIHGSMLYDNAEEGAPGYLLKAFQPVSSNITRFIPQNAQETLGLGIHLPRLFDWLESGSGTKSDADMLAEFGKAFREQYGMDYRKEIINQGQGDLARFTVELGDEANPRLAQCSIMEIQDPAAMEKTIRTIMSKLNSDLFTLKESDHHGGRMFEIMPADSTPLSAEMPVALVYQRYLAYGDKDAIRLAVDTLEGGKPSIASNQEFKPLREIIDEKPQIFLGMRMDSEKQNAIETLENPLTAGMIDSARIGEFSAQAALSFLRLLSNRLETLFISIHFDSRRTDVNLQLTPVKKSD
ncbi:hypothetical protein JXA32_06060 [Candidatus Sumerlaeota bacterium]|nr:hypothetical protein [Candidatus Sumerlaeota bacterium]